MARFSLRRKGLSAFAAATAFVAAFVGAAVFGPAAPAQADSTDSCYLVQFASSGYFMKVENASLYAGARIIQLPYAANADEYRWCVSGTFGGPMLLVNKRSGLCLTTDGTAGDALTQQPCDGRWGVVWQLFNSATYGSFTIRSYFYPLTVDVYGDSHTPGSPIDAWYLNGAANQAVNLD